MPPLKLKQQGTRDLQHSCFIFLSLCKYSHHIHQTTGHQPCMVANPARGRLKRGNEFSPVPVGAGKFSLARQVRSSRPASACSSSTHRLNPALTRELLSSLRLSATTFFHLCHQPPPGQSQTGQGTELRTHDVHYRESAGAGPVVLKVARVTSATYLDNSMSQQICALLFPHLL